MNVDTPKSIKKMKVSDLKEKCQMLGLDNKGSKQILVERILQFYGIVIDENDDSFTSEKMNEIASVEVDTNESKNISNTQPKTPITFKDPEQDPDFNDKNDFELDYNNEENMNTSPARIERSGSDDSYMKLNESDILRQKNEGIMKCHKPAPEEYEVKYMDHVHLDPYVNDSHFIMADEKYLTGSQITRNELNNFWCGVKATHGINSGSGYFTCKYVENISRNIGFLRLGFSASESSLHLGDSSLSCGYDSCGKIYSNMKVVGTARKFDQGDSITVLLTLTSSTAIFSFFMNDEDVGHTVNIDVNRPCTFFPHVYFKNVKFQMDFSPRSNFPNYTSFDEVKKLIPGPRPPLSFSDSELVIMVGIMGAGKSTWVKNWVSQSGKRYDIIGRSTLFDRWRLIGDECVPHLSERLVSQALSKLIAVAHFRPRNYIIDQTNYMASTRAKRLRYFSEFGIRKAVVVMPRLSELDKRIEAYKVSFNSPYADNRYISLEELAEFKENVTLPTLDEGFTEIIYVDCDEKSVNEVLADYKYDAKIYKESHPPKIKKMTPPKIPRILPPKSSGDFLRPLHQNKQYRKESSVHKIMSSPKRKLPRMIPHHNRTSQRSPIKNFDQYRNNNRFDNRRPTSHSTNNRLQEDYDKTSYSQFNNRSPPRIQQSRKDDYHHSMIRSLPVNRVSGRYTSSSNYNESRRPYPESRPFNRSPEFNNNFARRPQNTRSYEYSNKYNNDNNRGDYQYDSSKRYRQRYDNQRTKHYDPYR